MKVRYIKASNDTFIHGHIYDAVRKDVVTCKCGRHEVYLMPKSAISSGTSCFKCHEDLYHPYFLTNMFKLCNINPNIKII
jgi:hypothetical protein